MGRGCWGVVFETAGSRLRSLADWTFASGIATAANHSTSPDIPWLDFSGAPPMLIPRRLATLWRGPIDPSTNEYRELDMENLLTDYDRACAVAWPGKSLMQFRDAQVLILYTEADWHTWDGVRQIVACCRWLPSDDELRQAIWTDRIEWHSNDNDLLGIEIQVEQSIRCRREGGGDDDVAWHPSALLFRPRSSHQQDERRANE
jgi:hypothetical protein